MHAYVAYYSSCVKIQLTEVGTRVHTIITSDPDIGDSGSVEFTLVSNGDFVTVSKKDSNVHITFTIDTGSIIQCGSIFWGHHTSPKS